jgi:hypothetical protein
VQHTRKDGPSEVQLAVSRDLKTWTRPFRTAAIPRGRVALDKPKGSDEAYAESEWDSCWFNNVGPGIERGDEVWFYYHAANTGHGHPATFSGRRRVPRKDHWKFGPVFKNGRGLAVWRRDRFVSVDGPAEGGSLTTVPMVFEGNRLEINAAAGAGGRIVVEMLDATSRPLALSKPFSGDELRHKVEWTTPVDLQELSGSPISLKFHLKSAQLYAFAFRK